MATTDLLGKFDYIESASGLKIDMARALSVTFISFAASGDQTMTFTQHVDDGTGAPTSEADLTFTSKKYHRAPAVSGAPWSELTISASNVANPGDDATNDNFVVTVRARELTAGYRFVECTAATGNCHAIIELAEPRDPTLLTSTV